MSAWVSAGHADLHRIRIPCCHDAFDIRCAETGETGRGNTSAILTLLTHTHEKSLRLRLAKPLLNYPPSVQTSYVVYCPQVSS